MVHFPVVYLLLQVSQLAYHSSATAEDTAFASAIATSLTSNVTDVAPNEELTKYFHEHGMDDQSRHYDARYFIELLPDTQRKEALAHLIKSYLLTFERLGLETWLAHGTLLGWYWSARVRVSFSCTNIEGLTHPDTSMGLGLGLPSW